MTPDEHADAIAAGRDRTVAFARTVAAERWGDRVLGEGDPRPVGVVLDHVGHSYEYIGGFLRQLADGADPEVDSDRIDALNAEHATARAHVTRSEAVERLTVSGDAVIAFVRSLPTVDGRTELFCQILARHGDGHVADLRAGL